MTKIDEAIAALTKFYGSYKRRARLRQLAKVRNMDLNELHNVFRERWVFSDFAAVKAIIKSWPVFILDLQKNPKEPRLKE